jgi:type I restriction enzyme R subunit
LIEKFIETVNNASNIEEDWRVFIEAEKSAELGEIIKEESLNPEATQEFMKKAFTDGEMRTAGTDVIKLLPAKNMFSPSFEHALQKAFVIDKLKAFFERFSNL